MLSQNEIELLPDHKFLKEFESGLLYETGVNRYTAYLRINKHTKHYDTGGDEYKTFMSYTTYGNDAALHVGEAVFTSFECGYTLASTEIFANDD